MCRSTRGTQAASLEPVRKQQPNQPAGVRAPVVAPNAFLGFSERVPQIAYVTSVKGDKFLGDAIGFYEFFGLNVVKVRSIHDMVKHLSTQTGVFERLVLVSHAHPRGMLLPMFTGGVNGTNKEFFNALGKSDLDGLLVVSPFTRERHVFPWRTVISGAMRAARAHNAKALVPFGLDKSGSPPSGDMLEFFHYCFDIVFAKEPGRVSRNAAQTNGITGQQRTILVDFVLEILNQLAARIAKAGKVKAEDLTSLRDALTGIKYGDLNLDPNAHFELGLDDESMNDLPTLKVTVAAIRGGFRKQLDLARERIDATTLIDIRGCRAGDDEKYVESVRVYFGAPGKLPVVTAPRLFQSYSQVAWDPLDNRAHIRLFLSQEQRGHSPDAMRQKFGQWADFIRIRPLHTDFWEALLSGPAARFAALTWRTEIPALFIPAPGLEDLKALDFAKVIGKLKDYFNVPNAEVPPPATLNKLKPLITALPGHAASLFAPVPDKLVADKLQKILEGLQRFNDEQQLTIVPANVPSVTVVAVRQFQKSLLDHFDGGPLAPVKKFMVAAATSLKDEDGLYYYLLHAGLPVFLFGRPELPKNSIVLIRPHQKIVTQSWYRCLWADALPAEGKYKNHTFVTDKPNKPPSKDLGRVSTLHVEDDRVSVSSICPLPRYGFCLLKRPLTGTETDGPCGDFSNP